MLKCDICKGEVVETFLGKIIGTYMYVNKKKKIVCNHCQKGRPHEELLEKLK
ncbi:MAG: hypothetical protein KJ674_02325 [Nanoarchaeota archaeon]|nr:hypothetical protein [Nanoarchaeota archaeon]